MNLKKLRFLNFEIFSRTGEKVDYMVKYTVLESKIYGLAGKYTVLACEYTVLTKNIRSFTENIRSFSENKGPSAENIRSR